MTPQLRLTAVAVLAGVIALSSAFAGGSAFSTSAGPARVVTSPGKNGRIAFRRYLDTGHSTGAIYTIAANGTAEQQVTKPTTGIVDDNADWSRDASLIVFTRCAPDLPCIVYTVRPDGSNETRLTPCSAASTIVDATCEDGQDGSFLPDGKHVVYTRATGAVRHFAAGDQIQHSDLVVRDVDGANLRVLVRSRPYEGDYLGAKFSPNGSMLLYVRANSPGTKPAGLHAIFVARAGGSGRHQITPWSLDAGDDPDWSPDGKLILFRSHEGGGDQSQIYVVRPDGSGRRQLTHVKEGTSVLSSSYSPDGKWITFGGSGRGGNADVFVMRSDGTAVRPVTRTTAWDSAPDWGPAG
jgi:TolB protein